MAGAKDFTTFKEQVDILENEKGILIPDHQDAEEILQHIGYFSLMGGYKHLFRIPLTKKYKSGTSFDEIVALYHFDTELRELFFKYLLQIERHLTRLIDNTSGKLAHIDNEELLEWMGFPPNWKNITRYHLN